MIRKLTLVAIAVLTGFSPCYASRTVTDEAGRTVNVPDHPHRIVSLVPNITDDVFALGAGEDVVGISDFVEYPAEARSKPAVGTITDPSIEAIVALHPDLILGTPYANNQNALDSLQHLGIPIFLVDPHGVAGILRSLTDLGNALSREPQAAALVARLSQRVAAVRARVQGKSIVNVFMPVSYDPVFTIGKGSYITEIVALAGGRSITDDLNLEWPEISLEAVVARAPDALLMLRGGSTTLDSLEKRPGWKILPAVRHRRVYYVDKRIDFPSPVAIDALEDLARQFHP
jgi:iron complex transport system substrate-binding protein